MKTWYCVTSKWYDDRHGWSGITNKVEAEKRPLSSFQRTREADVYTAWFGSYDEAERFVREAKRA